MKIAIFHYHLKPGGVTDVIVYSLRAIIERIQNLEEIRLVTGEAAAHGIMDRIRDGLDRQTGDKLKLDILEELAYTGGSEGLDVQKLTERLEARYGEDTLWWIHNYHLGKNPSFTAALMKIASKGNQDMLLHIHDFPECGRRENLARLDALLPEPPYPSGPRIRYAVINERDRRILANAGLGDSTHLLSNPLPLRPLAETDPAMVHQALDECCRKDNPGYISGAPLLLYPVRAIRRKNILEAALLTRMLETPYNLLVTLPGVSAQEKHYSDTVEGAFKEGLIQGVWCPEGTGDQRLAYPCLAASCDAVISTSVQEGFGYMFLNALHWRKPLLARYLDVLDGVIELFGDYPRRFWADFRVPATEELIQRTKAAYEAKMAALENELPPKVVKSMKSAVTKIASGGGIDISFLSVDDQMNILRLARDNPDWADKARTLNRDLLDSVELTLRATAPDMDQVIEKHFGEKSYAKRFIQVLSSFNTKVPSTSPAKIRESITKAFGRIDYSRLLYNA